MPTDQTPQLATQSNRIAARISRGPLYIELRAPASEPSPSHDRVHERKMEDPERWDGMG